MINPNIVKEIRPVIKADKQITRNKPALFISFSIFCVSEFSGKFPCITIVKTEKMIDTIKERKAIPIRSFH